MIKRMIQNHHQRGFTLLEVMVTVLVLSIGLLGVAALQVIGLRSNHGAYLSSQAAILAYDMADRIRANSNNAGAYVASSDCPENLPTTPLATVDLAEWSCALEGLLPSGTGEVTNPATDQYLIRVEWADTQAAEDTPWNFELTIQL